MASRSWTARDCIRAAALELAQALAAAKGPSDVIALSSAHARRQMELIVEQNRQLWSVAQKIAGAMAKPGNSDQ